MDDIAREIAHTLDMYKAQGRTRRDAGTGRAYVVVEIPTGVFKDVASLDIPIPNPDFRQPAADFEQKYGLRHIARSYHLPQGISAPELEAYALLMHYRSDLPRAVYLGKMAALWEDLVDRNPDLGKIKYDLAKNPDAHYFLAQGVASGFNPDDIGYFVQKQAEKKPPYAEMTRSRPYISLAAAFNEAAGMQWAAAPETLARIARQFGKKSPPPKPPASFRPF